MPDHIIGSTHAFGNLMKAYGADPQGEDDAHFLLYRGDQVLALCLRHKFNPKSGEVWVGNTEQVALWGERLAALKDKQTVPLYRSLPGRKFYEFKGQCLITGDTVDPTELNARKGPVPLSRIVFIRPVPAATSAPGARP